MQGILEKIKHFISGDVFTVLVIVLVGFSGFGIGRLSIGGEHKTPIMIEQPASVALGVPTPQDLSQETLPRGGGYIASKTGKKYHLPWCSGAQRISEQNKIWFNSKEEAEKAGYTPAQNCDGI